MTYDDGSTITYIHGEGGVAAEVVPADDYEPPDPADTGNGATDPAGTGGGCSCAVGPPGALAWLATLLLAGLIRVRRSAARPGSSPGSSM